MILLPAWCTPLPLLHLWGEGLVSFVMAMLLGNEGSMGYLGSYESAFPPTLGSHSISFTGAQGVPTYKVGLGRGKDFEAACASWVFPTCVFSLPPWPP